MNGGVEADNATYTGMIQTSVQAFAMREYEWLKAESCETQRTLDIPESQWIQPTDREDWHNKWQIGSKMYYSLANTQDKIPTSGTMTAPEVESAFATDDRAMRFDWNVQAYCNGKGESLRSGTGPIKLQGMWCPPVNVQRARTTIIHASGATSKEHSADEISNDGKQ